MGRTCNSHTERPLRKKLMIFLLFASASVHKRCGWKLVSIKSWTSGGILLPGKSGMIIKSDFWLWKSVPHSSYPQPKPLNNNTNYIKTQQAGCSVLFCQMFYYQCRALKSSCVCVKTTHHLDKTTSDDVMAFIEGFVVSNCILQSGKGINRFFF